MGYMFIDLESAVADTIDWLEYAVRVAGELDNECEGEFKALSEYTAMLQKALKEFPREIPEELKNAIQGEKETLAHMEDLADGASY